MSLAGFDDLFAWADACRPSIPVVAVGGADSSVLQALSEAANRGWVRPIVAGVARDIETEAVSSNVDLTPFRVIDTAEPAIAAVQEVHEGRAQLLMKGQVPTPELMRGILNNKTGLRIGKTICQVVLMEIPRDDRCFLMSDTGITIEPTLEQLNDIVESVIDVALSLGVTHPRIAIMAATEKENQSMPETLLAAQLIALRGESDRHVIEGPVSFDLAYSEDAVRRKNISGKTAATTDAMVFPNLLSANLTVKAMMYSADCKFGGILCGTLVPVVFMSRADSVATRLRSMCLALRLMSVEKGA
jgi:phosphotransacetylase